MSACPSPVVQSLNRCEVPLMLNWDDRIVKMRSLIASMRAAQVQALTQ